MLPRGMRASAGRGRKSNDAVALERSKRIALVFGQIRPLKRPFGAVETRGLNGDVAILRPIMMTRRTTPALPVALRLRPCAFLFPTCSTGIAQTGFWSVGEPWSGQSCAPMGRVCTSRCSDACPLSTTISEAKRADYPYPLVVAIYGSRWFRCVRSRRLLGRLPTCPQRSGIKRSSLCRILKMPAQDDDLTGIHSPLLHPTNIVVV